MIRIYCDGAVTKEGSGGWAYIVTEDDKVILMRSGQADGATNNTMELMGPMQALYDIESVNEPFTIVSDSQYVIQGITEWIYGWKANGWISSNGSPVKNKELWKELYALSSRFNDMGAPITWEWVKGHAGNQFNEMADKLAQSMSRGSDVEFKWTHKHIKTGGLYKMIRDTNVRWEPTWEECALYEAEDGTWVVRNKNEFYDGRFEKKPRKAKQ
jgi:ribonuclease HI